MNFPRAWEIARAAPAGEHDPRCSYAQTSGALLCDCHVVYKHPEYLDDVLQGSGGVPVVTPDA
jgi:hypothetical protein